MDEDLLTIGAFSRATLLSPKALRGCPTDDPTDVTIFLPLPAGARVRGGDGCAATVLPPARPAVVTFVGPYTELSEGYRSLGAWLAGAHVAVDGPVRESYLVGPGDGEPESAYRTEIGWPVRRPGRTES